VADTEQNKASAAYGKMIARAWRDPAFKAKLIADPEASFKDAGVPVPPGVKMTVVENTDTHFHLVLPPKPTGDLSDEALDMMAGGSTGGGTQQYMCQGGSCNTGVGTSGPYTGPGPGFTKTE